MFIFGSDLICDKISKVRKMGEEFLTIYILLLTKTVLKRIGNLFLKIRSRPISHQEIFCFQFI